MLFFERRVDFWFASCHFSISDLLRVAVLPGFLKLRMKKSFCVDKDEHKGGGGIQPPLAHPPRTPHCH